MQITISVIITICVIGLILFLIGVYSKYKLKKQRKEIGEKALDYIANHTYEQMLRDIKGMNITSIAMQAYIVVKNFTKHCKRKNESAVYKDIQKWRREGKI